MTWKRTKMSDLFSSYKWIKSTDSIQMAEKIFSLDLLQPNYKHMNYAIRIDCSNFICNSIEMFINLFAYDNPILRRISRCVAHTIHQISFNKNKIGSIRNDKVPNCKGNCHKYLHCSIWNRFYNNHYHLYISRSRIHTKARPKYAQQS